MLESPAKDVGWGLLKKNNVELKPAVLVYLKFVEARNSKLVSVRQFTFVLHHLTGHVDASGEVYFIVPVHRFPLRVEIVLFGVTDLELNLSCSVRLLYLLYRLTINNPVCD